MIPASPAPTLTAEEVEAIGQRERGIPQAHEMARVLDSHEALRAQLTEAQAEIAQVRQEQENAHDLVVAQMKAQWFCQGGEHQFGPARTGNNADEVVSEILAAVRAKVSVGELADIRMNALTARAGAAEARVRVLEEALADRRSVDKTAG